ncbi:MAG: hypothetical protein ACRD0Y_07840 [Terriglobales bacterium]
MTLHLWLILFIISMAFSAEVLAWAVLHGQFRNLKRGNVMPLRAAGSTAVPPRPRLRKSIALWASFAVLALYWGDAMVKLVKLAL